MSQSEEQTNNLYNEYMNQVIPIEGTAFVNDSGISAPEGTTRRNIHTFLDDIDSKCDGLKKQKRNVQDQLDASNADFTLRLLQTIDELTTDIREVKEQSLRQTFSMNVNKNYRYRSLGIDQVEVPFVRPDLIPEGTALPQITSVEQIQNLTVSITKMYLQAYDIAFDNNLSRRTLKELLRNELVFTRDTELAYQ